MYSKLKRVANKIIDYHLWEGICIFFIIVTLMLVTLQIIARYLFGVGLWLGATQEIPRLLLMWYTFIAMAIAIKKEGHFRLTLIKKKVTPKVAIIVDIVVDICIACFLIFMVRYGFEYYFRATGDRTTSLRYDRNLFHLPIPVGGVLGLVYLVSKWINFYKDQLSQRKKISKNEN